MFISRSRRCVWLQNPQQLWEIMLKAWKLGYNNAKFGGDV